MPRSRSLVPTTMVLPAVILACGDPATGGSTDGGAPLSTATGEVPPTTGSEPGGTALDEPETDTALADSTSGTTEATASTSAAEDDLVPVCGDGQPDPGEECDYGEKANDDNNFCTNACKVNICGDGLLFVGTEDCDEGGANSDAYGSICNKACERGVWCGDNLVQPEHEQCDNGPGNGTEAVDEQGVSCDRMCRMKARRIFITSHAFSGDLGGLSGADEKCRQAAHDGKLPEPERFMALLSDAGTSMKTRYQEKLADSLPYVLLTGVKVADSYAALIEHGPGELGVYLDEKGEVALEKYVASNTAADGSIYQEFDAQDMLKETDCDGWTTSAKASLGRLGYNATAPDHPGHEDWKQAKHWLSKATSTCNIAMHLYCIEL